VEEFMNKQKIRSVIGASFAALILGATVAAAPAFAQKAPDDGGMGAEPASAPPTTRRLYNSAQQPGAPSVSQSGKAADDGGMPAEPDAAAMRRAPVPRQTSSAPQNGKALDDGGIPQ
jgi:hypothetical protein